HSPAFRRSQGKTQLFPGPESDFFRNRLTHQLEVGQIAKSIAIRLNRTESFLAQKHMALDPDLAEFAGWCHDLGHPPFGHTGEFVLDDLMKDHGGFEGNAQTLRILSKTEKKEKDNAHLTGISDLNADCRLGLNLTARSLASILKYDRRIPEKNDDRPEPGALTKGYYDSESEVVEWIKERVTGCKNYRGDLKTIECRIMDIADDIAYSTYDLEDALKGRLLSPSDILAASDALLERVRERANKNPQLRLSKADIYWHLEDTFFDVVRSTKSEADRGEEAGIYSVRIAHRSGMNLADSGYLRTKFTSDLVGEAIRAIQFTPNPSIPSLSEVTLEDDALAKVEIRKHLVYESLIESPRLKVSQFRGQRIIREVFQAIAGTEDPDRAVKPHPELLPPDFQELYNRVGESERRRVVCDFVSGMTDRYAVEFYGRLTSENPQSFFKPF
ncbi:MAG: dNTP triphosphohydrolase, partial [Myxococcales bacterium]|nr:dNTP triphosphohydrolase [Myxococcales bacterium]